MSEEKPLNEINLEQREIGAEGYIVREYKVQIKSHDLTTLDIIKQAEEQIRKLRDNKSLNLNLKTKLPEGYEN